MAHVIFVSWECARLDEPFCSVGEEEENIAHEIDFAPPARKHYERVFMDCIDELEDDDTCKKAMLSTGIKWEIVRAMAGGHAPNPDTVKIIFLDI